MHFNFKNIYYSVFLMFCTLDENTFCGRFLLQTIFFVTEKQIHVRCIFVGLDTIAASHPPFLFFHKPLGLLFESG
jgi:hypothetical protein